MTRYVLSVLIGLSAGATARVDGQRTDDAVVKSLKPPYDVRNHHCDGGTVTAVSKDSITVKDGEIVDGTKNPPVFTVPTLSVRTFFAFPMTK